MTKHMNVCLYVDDAQCRFVHTQLLTRLITPIKALLLRNQMKQHVLIVIIF